MASIKKTWQRIEVWFLANVPKERFSPSPGASSEKIKTFETELQLQLPNAVRELYRLHDGSNGFSIFPYGKQLLSLEEATMQWRMMQTLADQGTFSELHPTPEGPIKRLAWWNRKWVPFTNSGAGDYFCVDLDPDVGGSAGQIIDFNHEEGPLRVLGKSFDVWLLEFAKKLEKGLYRFDENDLCLLPVSADE